MNDPTPINNSGSDINNNYNTTTNENENQSINNQSNIRSIINSYINNNYFNNLNDLFLKMKQDNLSEEEFQKVDQIISYLLILSNTSSNYLKSKNFNIQEIQNLYDFLVIMKLKRSNPYGIPFFRNKLLEEMKKTSQMRELMDLMFKEYKKIYQQLTTGGNRKTRKNKKSRKARK